MSLEDREIFLSAGEGRNPCFVKLIKALELNKLNRYLKRGMRCSDNPEVN